MSDFVDLELRRNRGWPWPEDSWGLTPMFGENGWCRSCGVPNRPQCGSLVLQRRGMSSTEGAWIPNWQFDALCLSARLATEVEAAGFRLPTLPVVWPRSEPVGAVQVVAPVVGSAWFDRAALEEATTTRHGSSGAACSECGVWRWLPLASERMPPYRLPAIPADVNVAASPEWFGAGWKAFRQLVVRRGLAELIVRSSPRDFQIVELQA